MKKRWVFIYIFLLIELTAFANDSFDILQIDSKNCNLVLDGTNQKNILYRGKFSNNICFVTIPAKEFYKKYKFCSLSGILNAKQTPILCEFGFYDKSHSKISFVSYPTQVCLFLCVKK